MTPQIVEVFCDGIENVHRDWLIAQGLPEDFMPSWKDITDENPRLPYDEDAPETIEELFASLNMKEPAEKPVSTRKRPARRRR